MGRFLIELIRVDAIVDAVLPLLVWVPTHRQSAVEHRFLLKNGIT